MLDLSKLNSEVMRLHNEGHDVEVKILAKDGSSVSIKSPPKPNIAPNYDPTMYWCTVCSCTHMMGFTCPQIQMPSYGTGAPGYGPVGSGGVG